MRLLIDGSFISYRAFSAHRELATLEGKPTGLIYGFLRSAVVLKRRFPEATLFVAWDDYPQAKKDKFPDYKANRTKNPEFSAVVNPQRVELRKILPFLGVHQGFAEHQEADDVIGSLIDRDQENVVVSADRDFLQLVEDGIVKVFVPKTGKNPEKIYTAREVEEEYGVTPQQFLLWKVFRGDGSDNLPGVVRLPADRVARLAKFGSIDAAYKSAFPGFTKRQYQAVKDFRKQALINYELMEIKRDLNVDLTKGSFDRDAFLATCDELEMHSLKKDVDLFEPTS